MRVGGEVGLAVDQRLFGRRGLRLGALLLDAVLEHAERRVHFLVREPRPGAGATVLDAAREILRPGLDGGEVLAELVAERVLHARGIVHGGCVGRVRRERSDDQEQGRWRDD